MHLPSPWFEDLEQPLMLASEQIYWWNYHSIIQMQNVLSTTLPCLCLHPWSLVYIDIQFRHQYQIYYSLLQALTSIDLRSVSNCFLQVEVSLVIVNIIDEHFHNVKTEQPWSVCSAYPRGAGQWSVSACWWQYSVIICDHFASASHPERSRSLLHLESKPIS